MRNCFEDMIVRQSNRVAKLENPTKEDLMTVLPEDLFDDEDEEEKAEEKSEDKAEDKAEKKAKKKAEEKAEK